MSIASSSPFASHRMRKQTHLTGNSTLTMTNSNDEEPLNKQSPEPVIEAEDGVAAEAASPAAEARDDETVDEAMIVDGPATNRTEAIGRFFEIPDGAVYCTPSIPSEASNVVIFLTNSLGLNSKNNLLLADIYAERLGCTVCVPDIFEDDPITLSANEVPNAEAQSLTLDWLKASTVSVVKGFMDDMWIAKHTYEKTEPIVRRSVNHIISTMSPKAVFLIGYAFGGRYVFPLLRDGAGAGAESKDEEQAAGDSIIKGGVVVNPSLLEAHDMNAVSRPVLFVLGAGSLTNEKTVQEGLAKIQESGNECEKIVVGRGHDLPHGFGVPGDYSTEEVGDTPFTVIAHVSRWITDRW